MTCLDVITQAIKSLDQVRQAGGEEGKKAEQIMFAIQFVGPKIIPGLVAQAFQNAAVAQPDMR